MGVAKRRRVRIGETHLPIRPIRTQHISARRPPRGSSCPSSSTPRTTRRLRSSRRVEGCSSAGAGVGGSAALCDLVLVPVVVLARWLRDARIASGAPKPSCDFLTPPHAAHECGEAPRRGDDDDDDGMATVGCCAGPGAPYMCMTLSSLVCESCSALAPSRKSASARITSSRVSRSCRRTHHTTAHLTQPHTTRSATAKLLSAASITSEALAAAHRLGRTLNLPAVRQVYDAANHTGRACLMHM